MNISKRTRNSLIIIVALIVFFIIASIVLVSVCNFLLGVKEYDYDGWKTVQIEDMPPFKVPENWILTQDEKEPRIIYFTDKEINDEGNYLIYLVGTLKASSNYDDSKKVINIEDVFDGIQGKQVMEISGADGFGCSNGKIRIKINNKTYEKLFLYLVDRSTNIEFYAWDDVVTEETLDMIRNSFARE